MITESIAKKYFNAVDIVGKNMIINDTGSYKVTAVIKDIPIQSHFNFDFFVAMSENEDSRSDNWLSENYSTYIVLRKGTNPKNMEPELNKMMDRYVGPELKDMINLSLD